MLPEAGKELFMIDDNTQRQFWQTLRHSMIVSGSKRPSIISRSSPGSCSIAFFAGSEMKGKGRINIYTIINVLMVYYGYMYLLSFSLSRSTLSGFVRKSSPPTSINCFLALSKMWAVRAKIGVRCLVGICRIALVA